MTIALISVLGTFLVILVTLLLYAAHELKTQGILLLDLTASLKSTLTTIAFQKSVIDEMAKKLSEAYGISTYKGDVQ